MLWQQTQLAASIVWKLQKNSIFCRWQAGCMVYIKLPTNGYTYQSHQALGQTSSTAHSFPPPLLRGGIHLPTILPSLADVIKYSTSCSGHSYLECTPWTCFKKKPSLPKRGAEKEPCQAWGCPVGLFLMQAGEGVYSSGSSASSSPLVVLLGKKSNLGFYPTWNVPVFLLEKLVTSPHFPSEPEIGLISFTSGVSSLHDCHLWVSLRTGWPYYHSPGPKLTSLDVFFTSKQ